MDSSSDESAERQQQLEYYMEFVAFCKLVLDESAASQDAIRPWEDLARVRKYIQLVVTPYMAKMAPPSAATSTATQGTNRHELDNSNVHVAWTGRRHNSSRGGRPAIDRSVGGVPASYMNHHHASSSSVTSPLGGRSSQVSMESDDVDTQSSAGGGNATEYWRQHTALKAAHFETCAAVYHAFQHFLTSQPVDLASPQRQKLLYLLGFIEFCCQVLSESSATHSARAMSDLKRVVKSINKIVTPYRHKIASEQPPSKNPPQCLNNHKDQYHHNPNHNLPLSVSTAHPAKILPSVQDLLNGTTSNTNLSRTSIDSTQQYTSSAVVDRNGGPHPHGGGADAADEYWHHVSQLKSTYLSQVVAAHTFFDAYLHQDAAHHSQEHLQDVEHLCDYAAYCRQVLTEVQPSPSRTLQELHHVHTYITTLVLPHFASLQADTVQQQQQPPGQPKTSEEAVALETHHRQTNQHTDLFLQSIDHQQQHPPCRPDNKDTVGSRASTFESSTFYGVGATSTYWRKHAALKELYSDKVILVQTAFRKYASEFAHAKSAAEARKLTRLYEMLESVEFCAKVFDEQAVCDPARDLDSLETIHRCIIQIVSPYCQQVEAEAARA
ncbi:hypothetical protein, variant 1 [Aphanomyces astaci]|nr:hypothetical protein, variant 1 [Aphanomyces astaci]ETV70572.1 hypothetical protein, variant 1 [Aphanomyces astaci]|eukprot:XP_009839958.1 hypothetical protein, variant 1 [Aphanomyces astaci]